MFFSPAYASNGGFDPVSLVPFVLLIVVFYFFLIRPQQKKVQEHKRMVSDLSRGDRVLTGGGIVGQIVRVNEENTAVIEVAQGVRICVFKSMITQVLEKTFPLKLEEVALEKTPAKRTVKKKENIACCFLGVAL